MKVLVSSTDDIFLNLALEEVLMDRVEEGPFLFFWKSRKALVIGKNQNPWRECAWKLLEGEGGRLARRVSGGGTVYHDEGNLNYCFVTRRERYESCMPYDAVLAGLSAIGIHAHRMGRTSMGLDGRKFSGNAFCLRRNAALHHGTLLVKSELGNLHRYLAVPDWKFESRAVASEPAETCNLSSIHPNLSDELLREVLSAEFAVRNGGSVEKVATEEFLALASARQYAERHASWPWRFGETPPFTVNIPTLGKFSVEDGLVKEFVSAGGSVVAAEGPTRFTSGEIFPRLGNSGGGVGVGQWF